MVVPERVKYYMHNCLFSTGDVTNECEQMREWRDTLKKNINVMM